MKTISIVTNIAAPYRLIQINELKRQLKGTGVVDTYLTQGMTKDRMWDHKDGKGCFYLKEIFTLGRFGSLNFGLLKVVRNSDIVFIGGYEQPSYIMLSLLCRMLGVPYVIIYDGISPDLINPQKKGLLLRVKKSVVMPASGYLLNGKVSRDYFTKVLHVDPLKIRNQFLSTNLHGAYGSEVVQNNSFTFREKYKISKDEGVVLYSGRLIEIKNVELIIEAVSNLDRCTLMIAGEGVLKEHLMRVAEKFGSNVIFLGHMDEKELGSAYSSADCLVLPSSYEPWGLVVNEALSYSLPVVVSKHVGCAQDQVLDGVNGVLIQELTAGGVLKAIESCLTITKQQVLESSVGILSSWNLRRSAASMAKMIEDVSK